MHIIGAGYTGLIAGIIFPHATIIEASAKPHQTHQALLRFRTPHIGDITHIPFDPVQVLKSIWFEGLEAKPSPRMSNLYSKKVTGKYLTRSIDNIDPCTRYIAPPDFYQQLLERVEDRIIWGCNVDCITEKEIGIRSVESTSPLPRSGPIISTMPLKHTCRAVGNAFSGDFSWSPISTYRGKIKRDSNTFYTVYFPDPKMKTYRASITRDLLIVETVETDDDEFMFDESMVILEALGLEPEDVDFKIQNPHTQKYGKIAPIDNRDRKRAIYTMTNLFDVYSLGRFGTWRNILLDDVYWDLLKVRKLIGMEDYELKSLQV